MSDSSSNPPRPPSGIDAKSIKVPSVCTSPEGQDRSPTAEQPVISPGERLLSALWRSSDRVHQIGVLDRQTREFQNIPVKDAAEAITRAQQLSDEGHEVYFACAEYQNADSRTTANAVGACAFWLDIDVGEEKAEAGKGYATVEAAEAALNAFCRVTELPGPTQIVHSGGGLHVYWTTDTAISKDDWQAHARQLKALTKACHFLADDSRTADIASVLRIPDTLNHKYSPPRPVTLRNNAAEPIEQPGMRAAIEAAHNNLCGPKKIKIPNDSAAEVIALDTVTPEHERPDVSKLVSALSTLNPDCDEKTWKLKRLAPIAKAARDYPMLGELLRDIARLWSSGELHGEPSTAWVTPGGDGRTGEQAFEAVWQRFLADGYTGTPTTLGTIYYDAKEAGWREPTEAAADKTLKSSALPFPVVDPCPDPVDPAMLLDEVADTIRRFIVMKPEQADAAALWIGHTWFIESLEVSPLAIINAPEKSCGKSQLLDVMGRMSARALPVSNTTPAALFRSVERWSPTLLTDEADTFMRKADELKGIINAGHTRTNAFVLRVVGDNHEPKRFNTFCPKAMAGISLEKHLPDSTMSRAIVFNLRRKLPHEPVERLRHAEAGLFEEIACKLARFAEDYTEQVRRTHPDLPDELDDRAQDNWESLLAIAESAGPDWVQRATAAAMKLSCAYDLAASTSNELLADIQYILACKQATKLSTKDLIAALTADEEKQWTSYNNGKPITPRQLVKLLSPYGIKSKTVRINGSTPKGYEATQFADAFARYLPDPGNLPKPRNDAPKPNNVKTLRDADAESVAETPSADETPKPVPELNSCGVADDSGEADGTRSPDTPPADEPEDF